jgi:glutathione-independent formaldehyde dehydrogenase
MNADRLKQAASFGCETVDLTNGAGAKEAPATVLNSLMTLTAAGGALGIPGLYVTGDPGGVDEAAKVGSLSLNLGAGWARSLSFTTGQCPVMKYNYGLMRAILADRVHIARNVNAKAINLDEAPRGYEEFDKGSATKYVLNPNGYLDAA